MAYKVIQSIKEKNKFFRSDFDKLAGSSSLKKQIIEGASESEIRDSWKDDIEIFKKIRKNIYYIEII